MLWIKAFHIIFMTCWFAGLFYLPRLFVYHALAEDELSKERFKLMERKLYFGIMLPSALLTLLFGGWLLSYNLSGYFEAGWMHAKLLLVLLLILYHLYCGKLRNDFKFDRNHHSDKYYRWFNEVSIILLIGIVILAVVKPF